jgi:hypothetical protein
MSGQRRASAARAGDLLARHWLLIVLVVVGVAVRALTIAGYRPAFMFFGDSFSYIVGAQRLQPPNDRPFGYSALLRLVSYVGDLGLVVLLQHLAGVALAIALYVVLHRRGAPPWLAALVTAPLLLDAYLIQIEHNILSETMFAVLLVSAVLLVTRSEVTPTVAVVVGVLMGVAALTRTVAIPIAALFVGYLVVRRVGWRPVLAFGAALAIPVLGYMAWFASVYGVFATSDSSGRFLYGRVAVFADCEGVDLTPNQAKLCDNADPALRPNANFYVWSGDSPVQRLGLPGNGNDQVASSFARTIILDQPLTYARYVAFDTAHYFAPGRFLTRVDSPDTPWRFPDAAATSSGSTSVAHNDLAGAPIQPVVQPVIADLLRAYQGVVYTQGPLLLLGLLLGAAAGFWDRGRRRWDGPFVALVGLSVLLIPSLTVMFDYRYGLPAIPLLAYSGGIGAIALRARLAERAAARAQVQTPTVDAVPVATPRQEEPGRRRRPRPERPLLAPGILAASSVVLVGVMVLAPMTTNTSFERYVSNRAELGSLGPPLGPATPIEGLPQVTEQPFITGSIVARPNGAVIVPTRYLEAVDRAGGFTVLGAPRDREQASPFTSGERYVPFDNGAVFWSRLGGSRVIAGDIHEAWSPKRIRQRLKEPVADARTTAAGDRVQSFVGGTITLGADGSIVVDVLPPTPAEGDGPERPSTADSGSTGSLIQP